MLGSMAPRRFAATTGRFCASRPNWQRRLSLAFALLFVWTFVISVPVAAWAQQPPAPTYRKPVPPGPKDDPAWHTIDYHAPVPPPPSSAFRPNPLATLTLLDGAGHMTGAVSPAEVSQWKHQLHQGRLTSAQTARLLLQLGEEELGQEDKPATAALRFAHVRQLSKPTSSLAGLAAYDNAVALFYQGRYSEANEAFRHLMERRPALHGFDTRNAALWVRHAAACAGYHAERSQMGIPEPISLDPLCGAAALAECFRVQNKPFSKAALLKVCRVTERGSNLEDLITATERMGLSARPLAVQNDRALMNSPLPLTVFVEHDHFIVLTRANDKGVSYLCSDCGPWPGGQVNLTWKQWHALEPTVYLAVLKPGSRTDLWMGALLEGNRSLARRLGGSLAFCGQGGGTPINPGGSNHCGYSTSGPQCPPETQCPTDPNPCGSNSGGNGSAGSPPQNMGPTAYDPTNLANGQEEYGPETDLRVYNPLGPNVIWSRTYQSLRGQDNAYEYDDLGQGWSQPYNRGVYDPSVTLNPQLLQGLGTGGSPLTLSGTDKPAAGLTWDIVQNGVTIATSSATNGWSVSIPGGPPAFITPPTSAPSGLNYELRVASTNSNGSVFFDVLAPGQVPIGVTVMEPSNGHDAPTSGTWDVRYNGTVIASSAQPNGWLSQATAGPLGLTVSVLAPSGTALGSGYEARGSFQGMPLSLTFSVIAARMQVATGTKYLFFPNGSRVSFSVSAIPTAANPTVHATVLAGHPYLVNWLYDTNSAFGHYAITDKGRTQWITTGPTKIGNGPAGSGPFVCYSLSQQIDPSGNAINFVYSGSGPSGFPLLSSITDKNGSALLTFARATNGTGNLTSISDRYNRSVYYRVSTYSNQNVPLPYPQSEQEVDHVSQIVTTGTLNPPDRDVYGYQLVGNQEGESVRFLNTITVPSPTGTGTATATITYNATYQSVSSVTDANGNKRTYTAVDGSHSKVVITNAQGTTVASYIAGFDMNMSATTLTDEAGTITLSKTFADANDPLRPSQVLDGNGYASGGSKGKTTYTWDQYGNRTSMTSPYGTVMAYTVSYANFALGEVTQVQEGGKSPTSLTYFEPSGLLKSLTEPIPGTVGGGTNTRNFTYDSLGNLLTITMPGNNATATKTETYNYTSDPTYSYTQNEALFQPITRTDNLGHISHFRYDARGNRTADIDALGNETDTSFNIADQIAGLTFAATGMTGPGHASLAYTYLFPNGPRTAETQYNESGTQVWQVLLTYGPEGERLTRTGSNQPYALTYDAAYRTLSVTDGDNHTTTYSYNTAGYLSQIKYPNTNNSYDTILFPSYDANGNPTQRTDGRGWTTTLVYNDPESRLTDLQYPVAANTANVHITYDNYGRKSDLSDGTGSQSWLYDDLDNINSATTTYTGLAAQTLNYAYYPDGSRQSLSLPDGTTFTDTYDAGGRLTGLSNSSQSWTWSYLNNDWLIGQTDTNLISASVTRNARGFLTDLSNRLVSNNNLLSEYHVNSYDSTGNIAQVANTVTAVSAFSGTSNYTYDTKLELTSEQSSRSGSYNNQFGYDGAGNPITFRGVANTFNADNQNTANPYDGNGNPTTYKASTLTYDAENRLTAYGSVLTAGYRGDGLRAWKQNSNGKTYFYYDGIHPVLEENSGGVKTAVTTFSPQGTLARTTSTRTLLYTFDGMGNISQQYNAATGALVASYMFDSYGVRGVNTADPTASSDPYSGYGGQQGYYTDWETGLCLLGLRYYDSGTGRFLTRDPITYNGGVNIYEYVGNAPVGKSDPSGLNASIALPIVGGGGGASIGVGEGGGGGEGEDPAVECLGDLVKFIMQAGQPDFCPISSVCQLALNCLLGMGMSGAVEACRGLVNPIAAAGCACAIGAVEGILHCMIDAICNAVSPCSEQQSPQNTACKCAANATSGCAGGIGKLIGIPGSWLAPYLGIIDGTMEQLCDQITGQAQ